VVIEGKTSAEEANDGWQEALRRIEEAKRSNATELDLSALKLNAIPDFLAELVNLRNLNLGSNKISAIPDWITQLANLQTLDLSLNQIAAIPDSFAQLANLRSLFLYSNQISTIPDCLAQLADLSILCLGRNQIAAIPDSLAELTNLRSLYLYNNQISTIPDCLAQLTDLQTLNLSSNQITAIPDSFTRIDKLSALFLHGNPGLGIPDEILGPTWTAVTITQKEPKPPKEILTYYFSQRADSRPLNEAKLILVGQGDVGKTSLVKTLVTGKFKRGEKTTEGIKITDWTCSLKKKDKVTVHIWDFGGQEMMHATHQFFLTARSLYLLVLNRRQGGSDEQADYWLRLIRAFGGKDAPVIVVLNKQKDEPFDVNRRGWLEKYAENIRGFVETDCEDSKSMTRLEQAIQEQLQGLKSLKAGFPGRWFAIKNELARMDTQYVTFEEYRAICRRHGEADPESQTSLAGFLHDLGIALNYKDDPRLRFAYVLKPEWVTEGIYALLHAFVNNKGLFSRAEAEKVLEKKQYSPEAAYFILGLMEQFELSFALGDTKKRILIPQLLDDQQPELARDFKPEECLNFGYRYTIVPQGLLPRFIVRTHHLSEPATRWKSGVILIDTSSGCRALVRADSTKGQVRIHIDGPVASRPELLAIIRHNFEAIHADYEFRPEELVYPPGVPEKPLSVEELRDLRNSGLSTVPVVLQNKTVINPPIDSLVEPGKPLPPPLRLFLSYAHDDKEYLGELRKRLKLMERNGLIRPWSDHELTAGEKWEARILQELNEADVIICQLSPDFLDSDYCVLTELDIAIKRKATGEAELIAYVLRHCDWKDVLELKEFQILPQDAKPMRDWRVRDKYWQSVADGIQKALKKLQEQRSAKGWRGAEGGR
jgi:internalin A